MMRRLPLDVLEAADETAQLELRVAGDVYLALRKGLAAAMLRYERHVLGEISDRAAKMAEDLDIDDDDDMATDGPAALLMFARALREELPPDDPKYTPTEDDLVEVILHGTVILGDMEQGDWSVITADFSKIDFDPKTSRTVSVRLLRRSGHTE